MKLIILGIQGSGKGTQSKLIANAFNLKHISTGDLLRQEVASQSSLAKEISSYIDNGKLVPDSLITKLLEKNLPKDNFLLDGYTRNIEQAKILEKISSPDKLIYLELEEKEVFKRLDSRFSCKKCKIDYGLNKMPKQAGICDVCKEKMEKRKDDKDVASIQQRIQAFNNETLPLLNFYKKRVIKINGNQSVEMVFEEIKNALN